GGSFKIVNNSVPRALRALGYTEAQIQDIAAFMRGTGSLQGAPHLSRNALSARGLSADELNKIEKALPGAFDLRQAFSRHVVGDGPFVCLGPGEASNLLDGLGFTPAQIVEAAEVIGGRFTIEGAPHLKPEHLPVFDCANRCGAKGVRF